MALFTTSRKPCARTRTFIKELARIIPESETISRGKQSVHELADAARQKGYNRVAVVTDMHGNPHTIRFLDVTEGGWEWLNRQYAFKSVKLSRDFDARVKRLEGIQISKKQEFADALGATPEESETVLEEDSKTITFFQSGKEVGPRIALK